MGAFEFNTSRERDRDKDRDKDIDLVAGVSETLSPHRLRQECIIALKVYDSCRQPD